MNPETEPKVDLAIYEGLKASEIHTQQAIEHRFGKTGVVAISELEPNLTIINSLELTGPRFAGLVVFLDRDFGPSEEKVSISDTIGSSHVDEMIDLFYRDQNSRTILSQEEIGKIVESFKGVSATGELGFNFEVERKTETDKGGINREVVNLKQFRDFNDRFIDLTVEFQLGFSEQTDAAYSNFEEILAQTVSGNYETVHEPYVIRVLVSNGSKTAFDQNDPEHARKLSRANAVALKMIEVILHKTDPKSRETLKLDQNAVSDILELNKTKPPNVGWLLNLFNEEGGEEDGEE